MPTYMTPSTQGDDRASDDRIHVDQHEQAWHLCHVWMEGSNYGVLWADRGNDM